MKILVRIWLAGMAIAATACVGRAVAADFMFRANVDGKTLEGQPLHWSATQMVLLSRDGQLEEFNPKLARDAVKTGGRFVPYTASDMKVALEQEFGNKFEVSSIRHYLVVHPRGERDLWARRFEDLYNRFEHYFGVRGFDLKEPQFPLVAVVFHDRDEYMRYSAASGQPLHPNTVGHYLPKSNRVYLYDATAKSHKADWSENASTIIHEATHQLAFNTGLHRRFAVTPRWIAEGLATMFEAKGVWNAQSDNTQSDRVNRDQLLSFRNYVAKRRQPGSLERLLTTDDAFRSDVEGAYAEAWALSFYLSETRPRQYAELLKKTGDRPIFASYSPAERMADFQSIFGTEMKIFEKKFLSYMEGVK